jgi:hypothetical protein
VRGGLPATINNKTVDIAHLTQHPEQLSKETLYTLRELLATYPYYQPARLLLLRNLYLLHDSSFDDELRRAAIYITDRKQLFSLVEAAHYRLRDHDDNNKKTDTPTPADGESRTLSLIDDFLQQIPTDNDGEKERHNGKRKATPADATIDYVAYLLETEQSQQDQTPEMKGQSLIDSFISDGGKINLKDKPEYTPEMDDDNENDDESFFTETLAQIYIKQGRFLKALEIIQRINLNYPKKSIYFADQIRYLEKLILNNKKNK